MGHTATLGEPPDGMGIDVRSSSHCLFFYSNPHRNVICSADPYSNTKLAFETKEEALAYCEKNGMSAWCADVRLMVAGIKYYIAEAQDKTFKKKSYGDNFHWTKVRRSASYIHAWSNIYHSAPASTPSRRPSASVC